MNLKKFSQIMIVICIASLLILTAIIVGIKLHKPPPSTTFSTPDACADDLEVVINNPSDPNNPIKIPKMLTKHLSLKNQCSSDYSNLDKQKVCNFFSTVDGHMFNTHGTCKDLRRQLKACGMSKDQCNLYTKCCKDSDTLMFFLNIGLLLSFVLLIFFIIIYIRKK